jgi:hypothetical protein
LIVHRVRVERRRGRSRVCASSRIGFARHCY